MIRWTTSSRLKGEVAVVVPKNYFSGIECDNGPEWALLVDNLADQERQSFEERELAHQQAYKKKHRGSLVGYTPLNRNADNVYYRSRVCASFPFLMTLKDKNGQPLKLSQREWDENVKSRKWMPRMASDPYFANIKEIVASSSKLKELKMMMSKYEHSIDAEGKLVRQIFFSYVFTGTYIQYLVSSLVLIFYYSYLKTNIELVDEVHSQSPQA